MPNLIFPGPGFWTKTKAICKRPRGVPDAVLAGLEWEGHAWGVEVGQAAVEWEDREWAVREWVVQAWVVQEWVDRAWEVQIGGVEPVLVAPAEGDLPMRVSGLPLSGSPVSAASGATLTLLPEEFAGQKVKITGTLKGDTLDVSSIEAVK